MSDITLARRLNRLFEVYEYFERLRRMASTAPNGHGRNAIWRETFEYLQRLLDDDEKLRVMFAPGGDVFDSQHAHLLERESEPRRSDLLSTSGQQFIQRAVEALVPFFSEQLDAASEQLSMAIRTGTIDRRDSRAIRLRLGGTFDNEAAKHVNWRLADLLQLPRKARDLHAPRASRAVMNVIGAAVNVRSGKEERATDVGAALQNAAGVLDVMTAPPSPWSPRQLCVRVAKCAVVLVATAFVLVTQSEVSPPAASEQLLTLGQMGQEQQQQEQQQQEQQQEQQRQHQQTPQEPEQSLLQKLLQEVPAQSPLLQIPSVQQQGPVVPNVTQVDREALQREQRASIKAADDATKTTVLTPDTAVEQTDAYRRALFHAVRAAFNLDDQREARREASTLHWSANEGVSSTPVPTFGAEVERVTNDWAANRLGKQDALTRIDNAGRSIGLT